MSTGKRHVGVVIGSTPYDEGYMNEKTNVWTKKYNC